MHQKPQQPVRNKPVNLIIGLIIVAFAFLLYGNTITNNYSLDDSYVTQNNSKVQKGFAGIPEIFTSRYVDEEGNSFGYRPVALISFAIEHELWGQNPHMGHLINLLFYILILLFLFKILQKIFKTTHILFLLAIVLLFAAHPIHTETVDSLKNRETLLSFLFCLTTLFCFLKWIDSKKIWLIIAGLLFFMAAFLSKQDAITFSAVISLAWYYYSKGNLLITFSKGNFRVSFIKRNPKVTFEKANITTYFTSNIYIILSVVCFIIFILIYYLTKSLFYSGLFFVATFTFMLIRFIKNKLQKKSDKYRIISLLFLSIGIFFNLIMAINIFQPGLLYKPYFPLVTLICYGIFFFRIPENINILKYFRNTGMQKVFENIKIPEISIPKAWLNIIIPLFVAGIVGILIYKLPNLYLPTENKVVYNFENPQFVNDPQYSTYPLAFYTLYFYLQKLFWPHPLGFYYGYKMIPEVGWTTPEVIFSLVFHLGILAIALWKLPKKHILSFAILYYLVTISIFTNIVIKIPGIVGERLAFFPSLGFCIALAYGIFKLLKIDIHAEQISSAKTWLLGGVILIILIPYSVKTISRNLDWKDYLTLFSHDIKYLNNSAKANNVYAAQLLKEAFSNDIKNPAPAIQQEYLNLAVKHLKRTLEIDPTYKFAWNNLGFVSYQYMDKKEEGMNYMNKAVQLDPGYQEAHFNLGYAYKQQGNFEQSIQHFHEAQRTNPGKMLYYTEEADAWFKSGNPEKALILYKKASGLDSTSNLPLIGMGNIYWLSGDTVRAIENWEKAFKINPTNLEICNNLLGYYTSKGNTKAAYYKNKVRELQQKSP